MPFYLENSPIAMRMFVTKSMALNLPLQLTGSSALAEASKSLAPGCPIFGPEFVNYVLGVYFPFYLCSFLLRGLAHFCQYLDREKKIDYFSKNLADLEKTRKSLQASEANVSKNYSAVGRPSHKIIAFVLVVVFTVPSF